MQAKIPKTTKFLMVGTLFLGIILGSLCTTEVKAFVFGSTQVIRRFINLIDTPSSYNAGRILFESSDAVADDDNLFWDNENKRLGIGTSSPAYRLDVWGDVFFSASTTMNDLNISGNLVAVGNITGANLNIADWDTAFGWGDHSGAGYLTTVDVSADTNLAATHPIILTDNTLSLSSASSSNWESAYLIVNASSSNWDLAYGWGDHSLAGYLTTVDISANTNLTAGDYLTLADDDLDLDVEIYTRSFSMISEATTTYNGSVQHSLPYAITISKVKCFSDSGTATIQLDERGETTPTSGGTDVMSSQLVCSTTLASTTAFANSGIAADAWINLDVDAVSGSESVTINVEYVIAD